MGYFNCTRTGLFINEAGDRYEGEWNEGTLDGKGKTHKCFFTNEPQMLKRCTSKC